MPRKWNQLTNFCVAVLILLAHLKISTGQITTGATGVLTTELTALVTVVATTAAHTTSTATADTTVALPELPAYVPESVDEFNVSLYSTDFVDLYWTIKEICNDDGCVWDSYNLTYTPDGNPEEQPGPPLDSTSLSTDVTNLIPGENYNFSIIAVSGGKGSSPKSVVQRTIPETVDEFNVTSYLTETVELYWTIKAICEDEGCVWDTYIVSYIASSDTAGIPEEDSRNRSSSEIEINDLTPGESYNFSITVLSGEEESDFKTVVQRTLPEAVDTFMVAAYTNNDVTLSWTMTDKCENNGCVWTSFEITWNSNRKDGITDADRSVRIGSLTPGEEYTFDIIVISYDESSSSKDTTQRLRPDNVGVLHIPSNDSYQITIVWDKPYGIVSGYDTTITGTDDYFDTQHVTIPAVTYASLTPGEFYDVTVCTRSKEETCTELSGKRRIRTIPILPSAPVDVLLTNLSISSVRLTFREPEETNGIISKYIISYTGTKDGDDENEDTGGREIEANQETELNEEFTGLWPGFTYVFVVAAVNEAGKGEEATSNVVVLDQEEPVDITVPPDISDVETDIRTFTVQFSSDLFSHCNGELKNYSVFVVESGGDETIGDPPRSYEDAQKQKTLPAYLAIAEELYPFPPDYSSCENQRKKRQTEVTVIVVIGDGSCKEISNKVYCNGELHGNREYRVKYRVCNDVGCSETPYSDIITTDLHYVSWSIPLVIIIFSISATVAFIIWKKLGNPRSTTMLLKRNNDYYDDVALEKTASRKRRCAARPLPISEFSEMLHNLMANNCFYMREDFQGLCALNGTVMLSGSKKNPKSCHYDIDFVKIGDGQEDVSYECIKASVKRQTPSSMSKVSVNGFKRLVLKKCKHLGETSGEFIVCPPPSTNTNYEFWQMLWEQRVQTIIVIGLPQDRKKSPSSYWPSDLDKVEEYQDISLSLIELKKLKPYVTLRKLHITRDNLSRHITQVTFTDWPNSGVPDTAETFVEFVKTAKQFMNNSDVSTLIHCWNNDGPVGIFLSVYEILQNILSNADATIDILHSVGSLKLQRHSLVQTLEEFIFIYKCVLAVIEVNTYETTVGDNSDPYSTEIYHSI